MLQFAAAEWSPRIRDLPLLRFERRPFARKNEVAAIEPPDVVAARIEQLQLEIFRRRVTANAEDELIVRRQVAIDFRSRRCAIPTAIA